MNGLFFSVVLDNAGYSKGYGFIRFGSEEEQKHCLNNMNGFPGLGSKPIKVSSVIPKSERHVVVYVCTIFYIVLELTLN